MHPQKCTGVVSLCGPQHGQCHTSRPMAQSQTQLSLKSQMQPPPHHSQIPTQQPQGQPQLSHSHLPLGLSPGLPGASHTVLTQVQSQPSDNHGQPSMAITLQRSILATLHTRVHAHTHSTATGELLATLLLVHKAGSSMHTHAHTTYANPQLAGTVTLMPPHLCIRDTQPE